MTRTRRHAAVAALAAVVLAGRRGCGDDDPEQSQDDPTTAAPAPAAPVESASESDQRVRQPPPDPVGHAGHRDRARPGDLRRPGAGRLGAAGRPRRLRLGGDRARPAQLRRSSSTAASISGGATLDALAAGRASRRCPRGADAQRLPDVDLAGVPAFHIHYTVPGDRAEYDVITTVRNGRNVGLDFILEKKNAATNPDLIASVLATFRWTA